MVQHNPADGLEAYAVPLTDEEFALQLHAQDVEEALRDQALARSLASEYESYGLPDHQHDSGLIESDWELALRLATLNVDDGTETADAREPWADRVAPAIAAVEGDVAGQNGSVDDIRDGDPMASTAPGQPSASAPVDHTRDGDPMASTSSEQPSASAPVDDTRDGDPKAPTTPERTSASASVDDTRDGDPMAPTAPGRANAKAAACASCYSRDEELHRTPCGHCYCSDCLTQVFRQTLTDEALFPPRCCGEIIPLADARPVLDPNLAKEFEEKSVELSTGNRTYCHEARCATFIVPDTIHGDTAVCPTCARRTCSTCKAASHAGDCPQDEVLQQVLQVAQVEGWQRCERCRQMVELGLGCNHMTCVCGHQFCYVCGNRWRICICPQWTEARLLDRATQLVDRHPVMQLERPRAGGAHAPAPAPQPVPVNRQVRIEHMAGQLRDNAGCAHPLNWRACSDDANRRARCELCGITQNKVYACGRCGIQACYPCRRHRLGIPPRSRRRQN